MLVEPNLQNGSIQSNDLNGLIQSNGSNMSNGSNGCRLPACNNCMGVYYITGLAVLLIIIRWSYLYTKYGNSLAHNDDMNKIILDVPQFENCCSWWPISHFILFFIIGFFYPKCDVLAISLGIFWELLEVGINLATSKGRQPLRVGSKVEYSENWWAGSFKDVILNILGFYTGKIVAFALTPEKF